MNNKLSFNEAVKHPAYSCAIQNACNRASRKHEDNVVVYYDGKMIYVRDSTEISPKDSIILATVKRAGLSTVSVRFDGDDPVIMKL